MRVKSGRLQQTISDLLESDASFAAGPIGWATQMLPFTPGGSEASKLDTLNAKVVFDSLMELKNSSPNGASGLGQVTEREIQLLAQSLGTAMPVVGLSSTERATRLQRVRKAFEDFDNRLTARYNDKVRDGDWKAQWRGHSGVNFAKPFKSLADDFEEQESGGSFTTSSGRNVKVRRLN